MYLLLFSSTALKDSFSRGGNAYAKNFPAFRPLQEGLNIAGGLQKLPGCVSRTVLIDCVVLNVLILLWNHSSYPS